MLEEEHTANKCKTPESRDYIAPAAKCKYRFDRILGWVGISEPEEVEIEGEKVPVREFVFKLVSKKHLSESDIEAAQQLIKKLEKVKKIDEEKLLHASKGEAQTEALCLETAGLIRAILTLHDIITKEQCAEVKGKCKQYRIEDWRGWLDYLRQLKAD